MEGMLIDGIIVVSKNWNFLPLSISNMTIKLPLLIRPLRKSLLKCSELSSTYNELYQIQLCSYSGLDISLVLQSDEPRFSYSDVLRRLYHIIDEVLIAQCESLSYQRMAQIVGKTNSSGWKDSELVIYLADVRSFGDEFEKKMVASMSDLHPVILGKQFGQNCPMSLFEPLFKSLNLNGVHEAILHIATDVYSQDRVPMWRRLSLESFLQMQPTLEYYVSGIPGAGNFYFFIKRSARAHFNTAISGFKFYSSIGKHIHARRYPPFSTSKISNDLLQESLSQCFPFPKTIFKNFKKYNDDLNVVCNLVRSITKTKHYARCEVIIKVLSTEFSETLKIAQDFFKSLDVPVLLRQYPRKQFQDLMRQNVAPCVQSIRYELDKWLHCKDNDIKYSMTRDDYIRVCVSELILCFVLRGNVISSYTNPRHDNQLCRLLGLDRKNYVSPFWKPARIFSNCHASRTQIVSLVSTKVSSRFIPFFMRSLKIAGIFDYAELVEYFNTSRGLKKAAAMVVESIIFCTCCEISKRKDFPYSIIKTQTLLRGVPRDEIKILNGATAIDHLTICRSASISWIMYECDRLARSQMLQGYWNSTVAYEIENRMMEAETFLCFPGIEDRDCGLVVPFVQTNKSNYLNCMKVAREGLLRKLITTPLFDERLSLIYSRSARLVNTDSKENLDFEALLSVLNNTSYTMQNNGNRNIPMTQLLAFPFP